MQTQLDASKKKLQEIEARARAGLEDSRKRLAALERELAAPVALPHMQPLPLPALTPLSPLSTAPARHQQQHQQQPQQQLQAGGGGLLSPLSTQMFPTSFQNQLPPPLGGQSSISSSSSAFPSMPTLAPVAASSQGSRA